MPIIRFGGFIQSKISKFPCDLPNKYFYAILAGFDLFCVMIFNPLDFRLSAFEDFAGFCCLNTINFDMPLLSDNLYYVK